MGRAIHLDAANRNAFYGVHRHDVPAVMSTAESPALLSDQLACESEDGFLGEELQPVVGANHSAVELGNAFLDGNLDAERAHQLSDVLGKHPFCGSKLALPACLTE